MGWVANATPRPFYPRERPGTHCGPVWTGAENLAPTGIRSLDCPARSDYRLRYPGPLIGPVQELKTMQAM
jgi:hypothetical protein